MYEKVSLKTIMILVTTAILIMPLWVVVVNICTPISWRYNAPVETSVPIIIDISRSRVKGITSFMIAGSNLLFVVSHHLGLRDFSDYPFIQYQFHLNSINFSFLKSESR